MPDGVLVSVRDVVSDATATLARAGCETPRLDAELLLAEALGVGRDWLVREPHASLPAPRWERFSELLARRAAREPVAYILGRKEFRWISVGVDRRVLIPRPESELLVEVGLTLPEGTRVVDVGTGSGAVALALAHERPDLKVFATDASAEALVRARQNARDLGLNVHFAQADLLDGLDERFDAIVANLPYVPDGTALAPEIAEYEPAGALFGGADGLDVIRRLLETTDPRVETLALEVGFDQAEAVSALLRRAGFDRVERARDLAGYERVVVGRR